jgi:excisionase family DNA binding protein
VATVIVTTDEAAELAGVSTVTIRQWVVRGDLEPLRRGAKPLRFRYDDVAKVQREKRTEAWQRRHDEARDRWAASIRGEAV